MNLGGAACRVVVSLPEHVEGSTVGDTVGGQHSCSSATRAAAERLSGRTCALCCHSSSAPGCFATAPSSSGTAMGHFAARLPLFCGLCFLHFC